MSTTAQVGTSAAKKSPLPTGLLLATLLVIAQVMVRSYFIARLLYIVPAAMLANTGFLFVAVLIPSLLVILTIAMVLLIFARLPVAKPIGLTICILNILYFLYGTVNLLLYRFTMSGPQMLVLLTNIAYIAILAAALLFLFKWPVRLGSSATSMVAGASYRGMAQASLICAICGPLIIVILGPTALGLGLAARRGMREAKNFDGEGMALAGVIIGSIETAIGVLAILLFVAMRF